MTKLIMMRGLPASGKSTKAQEIIQQGGWVRINRDLLRTMLHCDKFTSRNEGFTVEAEKHLALSFLKSGTNVLIDDCNLSDSHYNMWRNISKKTESKFEMFNIETSVSECLKRDETREKKVGRDVIIQMALRYGLYSKPSRGFVLCDLDGTLCDISHRLHFVRGNCSDCGQDSKDGQNCSGGGVHDKKDWKSFFAGIPNDKVRIDTFNKIVNFIEDEYQIIFVSARPDNYRKETEEWLDKVCSLNGKYITLIMRRAFDKRPDTEVKQQIFDTFFKDKYEIETVIDDRPSVIRMWRENGLSVIDVGNGIEF